MAILRTLRVTGVGSQDVAGSAPGDLARLAELTAGLAGKSAVGHAHSASSVVGLAAAVAGYVASVIEAGYGVSVGVQSGTLTLSVVAAPNGGLVVDGSGVAIDPGVVSVVGHTHDASAVTGLAAAVAEWLSGAVGNGATVEWSVTGSPESRSCAFSLEDVLLSGTHLVGLYEWPETAVTLRQVEVVAWASQEQPVVLGLEVGGVLTGDVIEIPVGTANTDVSAVVTLNRSVAAGLPVRWQVVGAPGAAATAWHCALAMTAEFPTVSGTRLVASVVTAPAGGLVASADGVAVDRAFLEQVISDQLAVISNRWPVSVAPSATLTLGIDAEQVLSAEVMLDPVGGLVAGPSGVRVDEGYLEGVISNQLSVISDPSSGLQCVGDASLGLGYADGVLSGTVRRDPLPGSGRGRIVVGANGLAVALGTEADTAASGDHGHGVASAVSDGFLAASDYVRLQAALAGPSGTLAVENTESLLLEMDETGTVSGTVRRDLAPGAGKAVVGCGINGLYVALGTGANEPAAGNHTHAAPSGTGFRHVTGGIEDGTARLVVNADVADGAAIAESKLGLAFATHSNALDPSAGEKAALAGTEGTPSDTNRYVTDSDPRLVVSGPSGTQYIFDAPLSEGGGHVMIALADGVLPGTLQLVSAPLTLSVGQLSAPEATPSSAGWMSAADKARLDAMVSGTGVAPWFEIRTVLEEGGINPELQVANGGSMLVGIKWNGNVRAVGTLECTGLVIGTTTLLAAGQQDAVDNQARPGTTTATANGWGFASESEFNNLIGVVDGAIAQLNSALAALRALGLIAPSA